MTKTLYTWISFLAGLLSVLLLLWLAPEPPLQARGLLLLSTAHPYPPLDSALVLSLTHPPFDAKLVGHINIERRYATDIAAAQREITTLARQYAAQAGANAIVVQLFRIGAVTSTHLIYVFRATAYYSAAISSEHLSQ